MTSRIAAVSLIGFLWGPQILWAQEPGPTDVRATQTAGEAAETKKKDDPNSPKDIDDKFQQIQSQIELIKGEIIKSKSTENTSASVLNPEGPLALPFKQKNTFALRKRTHSLSWQYQTTASELSTSQGSATSSQNTRDTELGFGYRKNFGVSEFGISIGNRYTESSGIEQNVPSFFLVGEFNFLENIPGNDFIPYAAAQLGVLGINLKNGTNTYEVSGSAATIGVGLKWFPLSEIFALNLGLSFGAGKMDNLASPKLEVDIRQTNFEVGWRLYF